jgi:hypothetical protein
MLTRRSFLSLPLVAYIASLLPIRTSEVCSLAATDPITIDPGAFNPDRIIPIVFGEVENVPRPYWHIQDSRDLYKIDGFWMYAERWTLVTDAGEIAYNDVPQEIRDRPLPRGLGSWHSLPTVKS